SLRDWVPGDDLRHIDWKATARRGKVITRQYEAERRQQVLLVLDTGRLLTAEIAGLSRLDYVVRAALELAYAATQHDDNVGLMASRSRTPRSSRSRRCDRPRRTTRFARRRPKSCCAPGRRRWDTCGAPACWCWTSRRSGPPRPWWRCISI